MNTEKLYEAVKAEAGEYTPAATYEEIRELKTELCKVAMNIYFNDYEDDRHRMHDDIMDIWREMADVLITTEQMLGTTCGMEYLQHFYEFGLEKLAKHLKEGTLREGLEV